MLLWHLKESIDYTRNVADARRVADIVVIVCQPYTSGHVLYLELRRSLGEEGLEGLLHFGTGTTMGASQRAMPGFPLGSFQKIQDQACLGSHDSASQHHLHYYSAL